MELVKQRLSNKDYPTELVKQSLSNRAFQADGACQKSLSSTDYQSKLLK